jgi:hypothetical protein
MAVIDLDRKRIERLARFLAPRLAEGMVTAAVDEIDSVEQWRKAARRAARILGHRVSTVVSADGAMVCAILDLPVSTDERREAAERVSSLIFDTER